MQIADQLGKKSYLDNWFHSWLTSTRWLPTFESMFQGGARGHNVGHLNIFFEQHVLFRVDNFSVRQNLDRVGQYINI